MPRKKTIMLLVTYQCNLRCSYCYEHKSGDHLMTVNQAKQYISEEILNLDNSFDSFEIHFMGGEPLLMYPLMKEVSEWLWDTTFSKNLHHVFAPTNGTLLSQDMKEWFLRNKDRVCLGLSFDGNFMMQNKNRSNSFSGVDLNFFADTWPDQSVKMTVSPETLPMLTEGIVFLHEKGFKYLTVDLAIGKFVHWTDEHLGIYKEELKKLSEYYIENNDMPVCSLLSLDLSRVCSTQTDSQKFCGCGEDLVCISPEGQRYACHMFAPISAGETKAKQSQEIDFSDSQIFMDSSCSGCILHPLCITCAGINYIQTGNVAIRDFFSCQAFKIQFLANCAFRLKQSSLNNDLITYNQIEQIINNIT